MKTQNNFRLIVQALIVLVLTTLSTVASAKKINTTTATQPQNGAFMEPATVSPLWILSQNPNADGIVIKNNSGSEPVNVTITDKNGRVVYESKAVKNNLPINVRSFREGKYNVILQNNEQSTIYKLNIL